MFKGRRRRITNSAPNSNSASLMNLSLFIMLLAFFIVLNAISSFEDVKKYPVVESVKMTFSSDAIREDVSPSVAPDEQKSIHQGDTIERIDALFESQISSYDVKKSPQLGTMQVELPLEVFATAVMTIGQEDLIKASPGKMVKGKKFFLPTLVSILKSDEQGVPYRMDMIMHVKDNPAALQNRDPKMMAQVMVRGAELATQLEKTGLTQRMISIGVNKGDPEKIDLIFRPHEPFTPLDERGEEGQ
jgi:hypothetical protein